LQVKKKPDISKKFPNFGNRTIPKLAKAKSSENSFFCRALKIDHPTTHFIDKQSKSQIFPRVNEPFTVGKHCFRVYTSVSQPESLRDPFFTTTFNFLGRGRKSIPFGCLFRPILPYFFKQKVLKVYKIFIFG